MGPFTCGAADRIRQFGDHIGVTDRYTGYRNNLTRGTREPFKMGTSWMDKNTQGGYLRGSFGRSNSKNVHYVECFQLNKKYQYCNVHCT